MKNEKQSSEEPKQTLCLCVRERHLMRACIFISLTRISDLSVIFLWLRKADFTVIFNCQKMEMQFSNAFVSK